MTKKLEDLFESFTSLSIEEQFEKISKIRDTRSIERPAVAVKRRKKAAKKSEKQKDTARQLIMNLSAEEREELLRRLKENE